MDFVCHVRVSTSINTDGSNKFTACLRLSAAPDLVSLKAAVSGLTWFKSMIELFAGPAGRIIATGGASKNKVMLQVLSDVFNTPVYVLVSFVLLIEIGAFG